MLSESEQRALDAIAQQMQTDDPEFCRTLDSRLDRQLTRRRRWWRAVALISGVLGLAVVALGMVAFSLSLIFLGCLVAIAGWGGFVLLRKAPPVRQSDGTTATGWTWA